MLIVRVRAPRERLSRAVQLARGYVVGVRRGKDGGPEQIDLVLRDPALAEKLRGDGMEVEVLLDSATRPDPRDEVSKGNRYAEEVARLQGKAAKPESR